MTFTIRPQYSEQIGTQNRTLVQYQVMTGEENSRRYTKANFPRSSVLIKGNLNSPGRALCARTLVDLLVRLDPLVQRVGLDTSDNEYTIGDLSRRFPIRVSEEMVSKSWDCTLSIGSVDGSDLAVDCDGWIACLNRTIDQSNDKNPLGALAAATLVTAETFKKLIMLNFPDSPISKRAVLSGPLDFSVFSYGQEADNPPLNESAVDAFLIGAGGIAAGLLCSLSNLGSYVKGTLRIVDDDIVGLENLNRLTYATLKDFETGARKADSAAGFLNASGNINAIPFPKKFGDFKETISSFRKDRKYGLVLTTVDNDEARLEAQRDLPLDLLDAGTGIYGNCRMEHVDFLKSECLGCRIASQPSTTRPEGESCGCLADNPAPSLSFLSFFPGILLASEIIKKYSFPEAYLNGYIEHIFLYPPNPDNRGSAGKVDACSVQCQSAPMVEAYKQKYR